MTLYVSALTAILHVTAIMLCRHNSCSLIIS